MVQSGCLVPLNVETCSPQTILILPLCYCPMCPIQWDRVQLNWTWFFSREGGDTESETGGRREGAREEGARWGTARAHTVKYTQHTHTHTRHARHSAAQARAHAARLRATRPDPRDPDRLTRQTHTSVHKPVTEASGPPPSRFRTSTDSSRSHTDTPVLGDVKDRSCHRC